MQFPNVHSLLTRIGSIAAVILILLTISWVILLVYPAPPPPDAHPVERLSFIEMNDHWQLASFIVAVLMAVAYIPVWLALAAVILPRRQTVALIVAALGILYGPVFAVGYWTQLTTVRGLNRLRETNVEAAIALAEAFNFSGNFWTGSFGIVIAGVVIWGLATLMICAGTVDMSYGPARTTGALFGVAGLLAIIGGVGFAAEISFLEYCLMISGVLAVPALAGTAVMLNQEATTTLPQVITEPVLQ